MVEVTVELLASIAVTVLLMLVFLGVVVAWDIALALRDVAEKIDSLEDDVDEDLGKVDGTLTRIHDRMSEVAAAQQKRFEGARAAQGEYPQVQGDYHGTAAPQNATQNAPHSAPHGQRMNAQSSVRSPSSPRSAGPSPTRATVGVGAPSRRSTGAPVGRTGKSNWSPDGSIGRFQRADRTQTRKEADSEGIDAAAVEGDDSVDEDTDAVADADETEGDADDGSADDGSADDDTVADDTDEADEDSVSGGETPDDDEFTDGDEVGDQIADADTSAEESSVEGAGDANEPEDVSHDRDGDADEVTTDGDSDPTADGTEPETAASAGASSADSGVDDADAADTGEDLDSGDEADAAVATEAAAEDADSAAETEEADDSPEDIQPDRSAARAVQNFGRDARTNRGFGSTPTGPQASQGDDQDSPDTQGTPAESDSPDETGSPEADAKPAATDDSSASSAATADADSNSNVGRFETEAAEPWYQTGVDRDGAEGGEAEQAVEPDADPAPEESVEADDESGTARASSDGGTVASSGRATDAGNGLESVEAAAATVLTATEPEEEDPDTDASSEEPSQDDGEDERGIADLVNQELHSLTQEVGGTSLSPDVSAMTLRKATAELDDTSYSFPLSGQQFVVTATAEGEVVSLRFTPDGTLNVSGARERLLRYQLRNYLDDADTPHAEVLVDEADLVLELPGATPESLDRWVDAMIQIVDRTLYLTAGDD